MDADLRAMRLVTQGLGLASPATRTLLLCRALEHYPEIEQEIIRRYERQRKRAQVFREHFPEPPGTFPELSRNFPGTFPELSRKPPGQPLENSRNFPGNLPELSRNFPGTFPEKGSPPDPPSKAPPPSSRDKLEAPGSGNNHKPAFGETFRRSVSTTRFAGLLLDEKWWKAEFSAANCDHEDEVKNAEAWCLSNPDRAPKKRLKAFLHRWFQRAEQMADDRESAG